MSAVREAPWWEHPWTVLDFETTGVDPDTDRAVQVAAVEYVPGVGARRHLTCVLDPGVEVPQAAADIHGITTERARAEGEDPAAVIPAVARVVDLSWRNATPVVAMNAAFDVTLLDRELRRHAGRGLDTSGMLVVDPLVVDRACDRYRSGRRTLDALAAHYGVEAATAHDAFGDCLTAARVLERQLSPDWETSCAALRALTLAELQVWQAREHAAWAAHLQDYYRTRANPPNPDAVVDGSWPFRPVFTEVPS